MAAASTDAYVRRNLAMEPVMSRVAKITEIQASSKKSFDDAIAVGIARADKTLRNLTVRDQESEGLDREGEDHGVPRL